MNCVLLNLTKQKLLDNFLRGSSCPLIIWIKLQLSPTVQVGACLAVQFNFNHFSEVPLAKYIQIYCKILQNFTSIQSIYMPNHICLPILNNSATRPICLISCNFCLCVCVFVPVPCIFFKGLIPFPLLLFQPRRDDANSAFNHNTIVTILNSKQSFQSNLPSFSDDHGSLA